MTLTDSERAEIRAVLANVGLKLARTPLHAVISMLALRAWIRITGSRWKTRATDDIPQSHLTRIDVCFSVALGLAVVDTIRGAHYEALQLLYALRAGDRGRVGRAFAVEACYLGAWGKDARARRLADRAV